MPNGYDENAAACAGHDIPGGLSTAEAGPPPPDRRCKSRQEDQVNTGGVGFGENLLMGNPGPHPKGSFNRRRQILAPDALQMSFGPAHVALAHGATRPVPTPVQHMQQNNLAVQGLGETTRQRDNLQRAPRQIDRQQQPVERSR